MNSYHVKYRCLQELEEGILKPREAAKKYNVNNRTISRWKADAESIRQRVEEAPPGAKLTRKPRTDFKRKERPLTKEEKKFKAFVESRGKITKLRMADVITKSQQVLPSSQGKQGHNLYMYVFRWLRRHNLMEYVAFNSTGRPKVHTSDEEEGDDEDMFDGNYEGLDQNGGNEQTNAFIRVSSLNCQESNTDDENDQAPPKNNRSDEMSVIYALASLADGSNSNAAKKSNDKNREKTPSPIKEEKATEAAPPSTE